MLSVTQLAGFGSGGRFTHNPIMIDFDGSTYLTRGADLDGNADGKAFTLSTYFDVRSTGSTNFIIANAGIDADNGIGVRRTSTNIIQVKAKNSAGTLILSASTTQTYTTTSNPGRHHLLITANLASAGACHIYVDGVEDTSVSTFTDDTIDFTKTNFSVGATTSGTDTFTGCLGQLYFNLAYDNTPTDYYNDGYVDFGTDGSGPTGSQPILFLNNTLSTWQTNLSSGGGMTENGTLSNCG